MSKDPTKEYPDATPMEMPAGFKEPETLENMMRRLIHSEELRRAADNADVDNWEDAEDFIIDEERDDFGNTPYEEVFDPALGRGITPQEFHERSEYYKRKYIEAAEEAYKVMDRSEALRWRRSDSPLRKSNDDAPSSPAPSGAGRKGGDEPRDKE